MEEHDEQFRFGQRNELLVRGEHLLELLELLRKRSQLLKKNEKVRRRRKSTNGFLG